MMREHPESYDELLYIKDLPTRKDLFDTKKSRDRVVAYVKDCVTSKQKHLQNHAKLSEKGRIMTTRIYGKKLLKKLLEDKLERVLWKVFEKSGQGNYTTFDRLYTFMKTEPSKLIQLIQALKKSAEKGDA